MRAVWNTPTIIYIPEPSKAMSSILRQFKRAALGLVMALTTLNPSAGRADTVASLLGNFTINQYCGLKIASDTLNVHYVVVFGQLPALRELHFADEDGNGVTTQAERDTYVGKLAPGFAEGLTVRINGLALPLHATRWSSSLPTEQGGFSLRVDVDFAAALPGAAHEGAGTLEFTNENYAGRIGWHEIVVEPAPGLTVYDTDAFSSSLTGGLAEALKSLPAAGPLDERAVHLSFTQGIPPSQSKILAARSGSGNSVGSVTARDARKNVDAGTRSNWIETRTRHLVDAFSSPLVEPRAALLTLLGALLLGAVHALSPGHGKSIVGAYLIGSRGTARHAVFLGATVTITHTLGVFALGFATLYASRFIVPERLFPILSLISALLVLGMGITLLIQRGRSARAALAAAAAGFPTFHALARANAPPSTTRHFALAPNARHLDATMHSHGGGAMHSHLPPGAKGERITWQSLLALGISGGLVPCPSAMILLLAAVALNKTAYGMLLVTAFSIGLAITLTLVGLAFLYARHRFTRSGSGARWVQLMPVLSAATITVLGAALCFGVLKTFG
jgi:nickel/cobalt transporter (NicO) family protein